PYPLRSVVHPWPHYYRCSRPLKTQTSFPTSGTLNYTNPAVVVAILPTVSLPTLPVVI
ncbi:hypothetical protein L915_07284, partial [Phytophthora nicotianae]